jgi:hypothetical protein
MDRNVYTQAKVLDELGRQLELNGKTQKARLEQLEHVLAKLEYLHYRKGEIRPPIGPNKLKWKPRKWEFARSRYWVLETARFEYYRYLAMTNPNRFAKDLDRIQISEDNLRRGRKVQLPDCPPGILESWSWSYGTARVLFTAQETVVRQIPLVEPYLVRVDYEELLNRYRRPSSMEQAAS